ncbi:MAG: glycosyltransferase family 2 protein [Proteobacteria bacterium]|nr:glycosyltransferase family 2 protein [Pseudomonadota bacterium]
MADTIVIGIPTLGRAPVLCATLRALSAQTRAADHIVVCSTSAADVAGVTDACPGASVLMTAPGLPRQRNAILDASGDAEIILFFDDDFLPDPGYVAAIERHMAADPSIVVATGNVLADGIGGPGLSVEAGAAILRAWSAAQDGVHATFAGYGCNMALRLEPMRAHGLRFDERLPLYGWQEDVDLSRRLAPFGRVVRLDAARGVHLGVKSGRGSGVRLGYSQVANPLYLAAKRHGYPLRRALSHMSCNVAMNILRAAWPEAHIDRRGRLRGNLIALRDLLTGRMMPERACEL